MKDIYELGCEAGLLNYIDHETPRVYFIHSRADLEDFEAFCKALTKERDDEIERLREVIRQADCVLQLLLPENHSQTTNAELASLLSSVGEKLSEMVATWDSAALGEKE